MIRDSVELNVPPAAVQYQRYIYVYTYTYMDIYRGGIILLFYRVLGIEHARGFDRGAPFVRCWSSEKVGVHIYRTVKGLFRERDGDFCQDTQSRDFLDVLDVSHYVPIIIMVEKRKRSIYICEQKIILHLWGNKTIFYKIFLKNLFLLLFLNLRLCLVLLQSPASLNSAHGTSKIYSINFILNLIYGMRK